MAVGTATAMLIGAGISAGANVAGNIVQAKAANKAAQTQADWSDKYMGHAFDVMAPWMTGGAGAMMQLNHLMGVNPMPMQAPVVSDPAAAAAFRSSAGKPIVGNAVPRPAAPPAAAARPMTPMQGSGPRGEVTLADLANSPQLAEQRSASVYAA